MNETEFRVLADAAFDRLEAALDACDAEIDWTQVGAGVVELEFANGSKIVVNRHAAAREIWVAARSGGFHFRLQADGRWVDTRGGEELYTVLSRVVSDQGGQAVTVVPAG